MKIRVLIVVGTVLLFSMAAVLFSRYRAAKHVVYAKLAAQLVAEGEYSGAIDNAKRALELRPNYPEAYHAMGIAYGRLGRFDEAEESLRKAVSLAPSSPAARFNLALVLEKKGKYEDALALLAQAEQMKGEYAKVKSARATIYYSMGRKAIQAGRMGEAEKLFLRAVESKPDMPEAHYALGELYRRQGKYKDAVTRFNSVIQISPGAAVAARLGDVYQKLGEAYVRDGNHEKAIDAYRRASVLNPKNGPLRYCLGIALVRSGDYEAGRRALGEAFRIAPDLAPDTELARDCVDRARHCLDAGDLRGAAEQLDLACSIQPGIDVSGEKARLSMEYGDRDGSSGNFRGALDYYREAEKLRPELPQLVEKLARALAEGGELKEAIERYERLSAKNPTTVRYIAALGDLYFKSGNYQKAAEYFAALGGEGRQRLLESYERWASAENDPAKAAALYQKCLELKPENADSLRSRMYLALARSGHHDEAIRKMEALLKKYPAPAPPTIESLCMQSLDDVKLCRGEDQFRGDYLWNFTTSAYPIEILGTFEVRAGKQTYKKGTVLSRDRNQTVIIDFKGPYAVESTSALLLSHDGGKRTRVCLPPLKPRTMLWVAEDGSTFKNEGLYNTICTDYPRGVPPYNDYCYLLGAIYKEAGKKEEANRIAAYHHRWALTFLHLGYDQECETELKRALELCSNCAATHSLAVRLYYNRKRYAEAARHARVTMELQPEDPIAVNDLGVILAAQGNLAEAEQLFLRASEMNASYIEPCINLAGLYRMTGKMRECAFWGEKNRQLERMRKTGTLLDEGLMIEQK